MRPDSPLDHVTPYDRFAWSDTEIEGLLVTGEHRTELLDYFGDAEYHDLVALARAAAHVPLERAPRVFVVPGIMGSQLGLVRQPPLPNDILWLDPIDIGVGRLSMLRVPGTASVVALGAVLYSYLRLKLHLRAAGFAAVFHDYDWRLSVDDLGRAFAARLSAEPGESVMVVAHSMGGLVSRAALGHPGTDRVRRLVLLGTPNFGSYAAVQALRGTYAVVRKIARLATRESAEMLAGEVFNTFPSLYQLLPPKGCNGGVDLFDPSAWPRSAPAPRPELLARARTLHQTLAPPDDRVAVIVGVGQETVTAAELHEDEFVYTVTRHGDGTVPVISARLPGAQTYYARVAHSDLTRDRVVSAAVVDLLRKTTTRRLPSRWVSRGMAQARISDRQLRLTYAPKVDWARLAPDVRRVFLQNLNEPPQLRLRVPPKLRTRAPASRARKRHGS
jgi:pimeloyl-ACP methyl ester carboxylesterase